MPVASDSFTGVDLSRLPAPDVIEALDHQAIFAAWLAQFQVLQPDFDATVESDPVVKLIELFVYVELLLRQRINDAARAVMPAYATGSDLDAIAAIVGVERFILIPANPLTGTVAVLENDADLRRRMVLAPEGFSVAGPAGAYIFHALSAHADVRDASVISPVPGQVVVTVLSRSGNGAAPAPVLTAVTARLNSDTVRPLTDQVTVQSAAITDFAITATLYFLAGPDRALVLANANARLNDHLAASLILGRDVTRAGIIAALHAEGVQNVVLTSPAADIVLDRDQAGNCTAITITDGGVAE
jgi:phage-related baseplate assembly protein